MKKFVEYFKSLSVKFRLWKEIRKRKFAFLKKDIREFLAANSLTFFLLFLLHRYSAKQFNPLNVKRNIAILSRKKGNEGLAALSDGKLTLLESSFQKIRHRILNLLVLNALQKRVEKVIYFTILTLTLERRNPFNRKVLKFFLEQKLRFINDLLARIETINGKKWSKEEIGIHIDIFERSSILQGKIIKSMELAVKRQKENAFIKEAKEALEKGLYPVLATKGLSGSYWMRGLDRRILGLFKPFDEEIQAPNNPVSNYYRAALGSRNTRIGCRSGESAHHEVAAFLVDEFFGFGIVPRTSYASFTHHTFFLAFENIYSFRRITKTKYGSFQEFVGGFISILKLSKSEIETIPLDEFQLLIVLDVILGNTDRNVNNILVGDEKIAAIDHGLCFPDLIEELSFWYWSYFKQGEKPLYKPISDMLNAFPFEKLAAKLHKKCFISWNALARMRERVTLFSEGINAGLVPAQLKGLFESTYLVPLLDRKASLKETAAEQVRLYIQQANLYQ
jgi:hypothetical protein